MQLYIIPVVWGETVGVSYAAKHGMNDRVSERYSYQDMLQFRISTDKKRLISADFREMRVRVAGLVLVNQAKLYFLF